LPVLDSEGIGALFRPKGRQGSGMGKATRLMRQAVPLLAAALLFVKVALVAVTVVHTSLSVELLDSASAGGGARSALDRDNQWWSRQHSADSLQGSGAGTNMVYMPASQDGHRQAAYGEDTTGHRRSPAVADHTGQAGASPTDMGTDAVFTPKEHSSMWAANKAANGAAQNGGSSGRVEAAAPSRATPRRTQGLFRAPPKPVAPAEEEPAEDPKAFWWAKPLQPVLDEAEGRTPQHPQVQQAHPTLVALKAPGILKEKNRYLVPVFWRQPRGKSMVSLFNSHANATRIG